MSGLISNSVIKRLPRYYRFLGELRNMGMTRISSRELSERMGLTASQIRQDLNCFGGFGQQGYGYNIDILQMEIARILGLDMPKSTILIGQMVKNLPIRSTSSLDEFCRENRPEVAVLCIPKNAAADIAKQLVSLGIRGFWNFSHYDLSMQYKNVRVENVHFSDSLMTLSYRLNND